MVRRNILVRATVEAVNYVQVQNGKVRLVGAILSDQTRDFSVMVDSIVQIKGIFELNDDDLGEIATLLPTGQ